MDKQESEVFNEVLLTCFSETIGHLLRPEMQTGYVLEDISGDQPVSHIKLIDNLGYGYKVKITIAGVTKYYIFDTGASFLVINSELEQELLTSGTLKIGDYREVIEVSLANNELVEAKTVILHDVAIGDYTLNNVTAIIIDGGSLLCGTSLLNKFRKWEIDTEQDQLILYK